MPKMFDQWCARSPHYNDSHREWADTVKRFVAREIEPHIDAWERAGELPRELHRKAAEVGLIGLGFPEEFGGVTEGIDRFHGLISGAELAQAGAGGLLASLMIHGVALPPVIAAGSAELKRRIVPAVLAGEKIIALGVTEPSGGSDVAALRTRAERKGDRYVINGSKTYITSGMRADHYVVAVRTGGPGARGISLLLVDKGAKGFTQTKLDKMGWHCSDTATLYFEDVEVPVENLIGEEGGAFKGLMANFNGERVGIASSSNAFAMVCLEEALAWARERETFGTRLNQYQAIRHKFSEMARMIFATQAWVDRACESVMRGRDDAGEIALLKIQGARTMEFCARESAQILGGASYMRGCKIERIYREVRPNVIAGGSEEIMLDLAAKQLGFV
ncbi:MAG: acyl-CoA dehydrogenase [Gammaproteobacteria bacterium]|nr:acyl-CoA dehydrogenase [Gammaproteobacteria bacterium]